MARFAQRLHVRPEISARIDFGSEPPIGAASPVTTTQLATFCRRISPCILLLLDSRPKQATNAEVSRKGGREGKRGWFQTLILDHVCRFVKGLLLDRTLLSHSVGLDEK